jgi:hypothetical protein
MGATIFIGTIYRHDIVPSPRRDNITERRRLDDDVISNCSTIQPIIVRIDSRNNARQLSPIVDNRTEAQPLTLVLSSSRTKRLYAKKTMYVWRVCP